jgi:serine/threonine-protein kinase
VVGTPGYIAPEQAHGATPTPGVDVYALGVVLYEMLGGRLSRARSEAPVRLSPVSRELDVILQQTLAVDPSSRISCMVELGRALRATPELLESSRTGM